MLSSPHRVLVALGLPTSVPAFIKFVQFVISSMTNNAWFPSPNPALATANVALAALTAAETATKGRSPGAKDARNAKHLAVKSLVEQLRAHVQGIADANPDHAEEIIRSAGMGVRKSGSKPKPPLAASAGSVSGTARLAAFVGKSRASHEWQWSLDQKAWNSAASTLQGKTTIAGLTPGAVVYFRHRMVTKAGESDWSQVVTLMIK
jgi:hypothetical protein